MSYVPGIIESVATPVADVGAEYGVNPAQIGTPGGIDVGNLLSIGKGAFQFAAPQTYSAATSFIPSAAEIGASLGIEGTAIGAGLSGAAGGAMAAVPYAGLAYAVAQFLKSLNDSTDHSVSLGQGESTGLGDMENIWAMRPEDAGPLTDLHETFQGSGDWYTGGDPNDVGTLGTAYGLIQPMKGDDRHYYGIGGAPYESPELAIASGRQIARSQMGLPVTHEPLSVYANGVPNRDLPVYDGEAQLPHDWDARMDWAQSNFGSGEGQSGPDPGWGVISEGYQNGPPGPLVQGYDDMAGKPRMQEWANAGYSLGEMYALTGENSPDYDAIVDDLSAVRGSVENLSPSGRSVPGYTWGTY